MSSALQGLNQIPGVIGSALFNGRDECIVNMMPPQHEPATLAAVMGEVRNALNVLNYLDDSSTWSAVVVRYDQGYLVVRQVSGAVIMVLAQPSLNPAMLSVGFNVAALKLEKEAAPPPLPLPLPPPPTATSASTVPTMAGPSSTRMTTPMTAAGGSVSASMGTVGATTQTSQSSPAISISQTGLSQSQRLASASSPGLHESVDPGAARPDAVGRPIMEALLRALARHIGPFAKLIMREELTKLGATATTLGQAQYEDFIGMLGMRVQDPAKRREFLAEAEQLPHKR